MKGEGLSAKFFRTQAYPPSQAALLRLQDICSRSVKEAKGDCQSDDSRLP